MEMDRDIVHTLVHELCRLQEERMYTYDLFNEGHKIYLTTAPNYDLSKFKLLVQDVTQELKRISTVVTKIEARLRPVYPELASLMRGLEADEKHNLELIAKLQLAKKRVKDHPRDAMKLDQMANLKLQLRVAVKNSAELIHVIRYHEQDD